MAGRCGAGRAVAGRTTAACRPGDIVITGGQLFDSVRDTARAEHGHRRAQRRAARSRRDARRPRPRRRRRSSGSSADEYVLPGLFDLHAHYAVDLFGEGRVDEYTANPLVFLGNGVTSTFPAGEVDPEGMMAARRRIERGEQIGPRILSSGPYFGTARPGWKAAEETPEQIRKEVDEWAARGVLGFKAKGIQPPQLFALIDEAHRYGLTVTGHLDSGFRNSVNPRDAIDMGIDRIEHFMGGDAISGDKAAYSSLEALDVDRPEVDAVIQLYLRRHVYYDATVSAYGYWYDPKDARVFTKWDDEMSYLTPHAREVAEARLPRRPNEQFHRIYDVEAQRGEALLRRRRREADHGRHRSPELGRVLCRASARTASCRPSCSPAFRPPRRVKMATINAAHAFGLSDRLGTIEAGKLADLVRRPRQPARRTSATRTTSSA